ncbi:MAG: hypothetical protein R3F37_05635 [Candidatus Competibacteraceae bacterium]
MMKMAGDSAYTKGDSWRIRQFYLPDTNILITRFLSESGWPKIMDFMPRRSGH